MDDPDPSITHVIAQPGTLYRPAYEAAFDLLRADLARVHSGDLQDRVAAVLRHLDHVQAHYRQNFADAIGGYVPVDSKDWTLTAELNILRHQAVVIHSEALSESADGDRYLLRKFWEYGYLTTTESMCQDARQDLAMERSGDLKWLIENGAPRQAAESARLTSQAKVPQRRSGNRRRLEQAKSTTRKPTRTPRRVPAKRWSR
jgi:hypothetical protein